MASIAAFPNMRVQQRRRGSDPIDLVHLSEQTLGDAGLESEVLRVFDARIHAFLAQLRCATEAGEIEATLHFMMGAARGVGAFRLLDRAETAKQDFLASGLSGEAVDDLSMCVNELSAFISDRVERQPS